MNIEIIPLLEDNYAYLLISDDGEIAVIDPAQAEPIIKRLEEKNLKLDYILNTHHHWDHTGGNIELKEKYNCQIIAPAAEQKRIEQIDIALREGDHFEFGSHSAQIIETPGHTSGHICFYFEQARALFCGDTLFSMGCGRLFEGTADQMWQSLKKIMNYPDDTKIYCGHEYTMGNGMFCLNIEPDNEDLIARMEEVKALREQDLPTIPSTLEIEKKTNAFLRAGSATRFAEIRSLKDAA